MARNLGEVSDGVACGARRINARVSSPSGPLASWHARNINVTARPPEERDFRARRGRYTRAQISTPSQLTAGETGANQERVPGVRRGQQSRTDRGQDRSALAVLVHGTLGSHSPRGIAPGARASARRISLPRAKGAEIGVRTQALKNLHSTLALRRRNPGVR